MKISTVSKDKPESVHLRVKSAEASVTIARGTPVVFAYNGTNDGLAIVRPSAGTAAGVNALVAGVAIADITAGAFGDVQCFGFNRYSVLRRATRAASSDSWASQASIAANSVLMILDTVNNCFSTAASLAASGFLPMGIMVESLASYASSDSATSDTRTAITAAVKTHLRMM
jgi:hypothetical protein